MTADQIAKVLADPAALLQYGALLLLAVTIVSALTAVITAKLVGGGSAAEPAAAPRAGAAAAAAPAPAFTGVDPRVIAAISAAVYTVMGGHRVVHIGAAIPGQSWTNEARLRHHTSHNPHA